MMEEINIKKRLRTLAIFSICLTLFLFTISFAMSQVFISMFKHTMEERMHEEANTYKEQIERQVDRNFQMLNTMASMISTYGLEQKEDFHQALVRADMENEFQTFGFYGIDGEGVLTKPCYGNGLQEIAQEVLRGKKIVSNVISEENTEKKVFVFGVPVYRGEQVVGALMASDVVDAFSEWMEEESLFYGKGDVHLLDQKGNYLIHGSHMVVEEKVETIMALPYLNAREQAVVREAMQKMKKEEFSFVYRNVEYHALLTPIESNGWYLLCINSLQNVNKNVYIVARVAAIFFVLIVGLFIFTLVYGYRMMKTMNRNLKKMAYYDSLTEAYNMYHFKELAREAGNLSYAIAVVNVRQFKFINEIFGKEQADHLLQYIARKLQEVVGEGEFLCRESADSFYVFLRESEEEVLKVRMNYALQQITDLKNDKNFQYHLIMNCGIAVSEPDGSVEEVMTRALFALAKAKQVNQQAIWVFDTTLHEQEKIDNFIESHAREALECEEFELYLQPKMNVQDDSLGGAEALVRWVNAEGTFLYPSSFIPLFETNGFCADLDMYMFEKVCQCMQKWIADGYQPVPISVNQSKLTFYEENYEQRLSELLEKYQIPASLITLEILEDLVIDDLSDMNARLERLKKMGFRISLDDFGTGYSSLNTFGKLKIDEVKLDRGFLLETEKEGCGSTRMIMEEVVRLAKKLSIATVIEGIETEEQAAFVKSIGCDQGQGYLYSKPISAKDFTEKIMRKYAHKPYFLGGGQSESEQRI